MFELKITIDDNGQCQVQGLVEDKWRCYGALELAKEAIHIHFMQQQAEKRRQQIAIPTQDIAAEIMKTRGGKLIS